MMKCRNALFALIFCGAIVLGATQEPQRLDDAATPLNEDGRV
jgi:hypothetical protein